MRIPIKQMPEAQAQKGRLGAELRAEVVNLRDTSRASEPGPGEERARTLLEMKSGGKDVFWAACCFLWAKWPPAVALQALVRVSGCLHEPQGHTPCCPHRSSLQGWRWLPKNGHSPCSVSKSVVERTTGISPRVGDITVSCFVRLAH